MRLIEGSNVELKAVIVEDIKKDRKSGFTYKELCKKYNTSKSTLSFLFNYSIYANK